MKISSNHGDFKIIQTMKNKDELLVLGSWSDLIRIFDSSRTFLINRVDSLFGIYLCKQECAEFMDRILQDIDYNEWEEFRIDKPVVSHQYTA